MNEIPNTPDLIHATATSNTDGMADAKITGTKSEVIPAIEVALSGQHLIEASAGTGKTWTLTGIVLRLLIEARRAPEQIIATTFTRAAADEIRQRIHDRLVSFYQLLQWVNGLSGDLANKAHLYTEILQVTPDADDDKTGKNDKSSSKNDNKNIDRNENENIKEPFDDLNQDLDQDLNQDSEADKKKLAEERKKQQHQARETRQAWLIEQAKHVRLEDAIKDPVNLHLIGYLLDHVHSYSMGEAIRRTALVLTTLDKLFVGTLDSLAQKWLSEYSSETGHQQGMAIIEDSSIEKVTDSIIHDELRQFQSRLYHEQPKLYDILEQQGKLTTVNDHRSYVKRSLNFISAPIDEIEASKFNIEDYEALLDEFAKSDLQDIEPYLSIDYRKAQGFHGSSTLYKQFNVLVDVHQKISKHRLAFTNYLNDVERKILSSLQESRYPDEDGKIKYFNKNREKEHQALFELETIKKLMAIIDMIEGLDNFVTLTLANLNRHIVLAVREKLPVILEERGETTFSLQMVRLNQALTSRQGEKLARYIRHHYPIALIDESQDINGAQAIMIESIYLPKNSQTKDSNKKENKKENKKSNHEFLLLVGDPKQAIYGFRGGDVSNYNYMKAQFDKSNQWTLDINRRSNQSVINGLNHWFGMPTPVVKMENNHLAELGSNIYYHHIKADKQDNQLSWFNDTDIANSKLVTDVLSAQPVSLIHLPYDKELDYDEHEITARHIATLLNSGQTLKGKPIQPSDIGVLARTKNDLKQVEDELVKLKIPTLTTSDVSIFETVIAEDVVALLSAMLYPYRPDMVNRVLTSHLYGLTINDVKTMLADQELGIVEGTHSQADITSSNDKTKRKNTKSRDIKPNKPNKKSYQDFIIYLKEGAQRWQDFGILSALHYLLEQSPIHEQGVWQALASHPEGDRHIMDLRHVMDILAQYGIGLGEHGLLAWLRQHIETAPNSDWAKQYPLPTESGVKLMTIHKSKGLEFPIVYVLGMGSASRKSGEREQYGLYLYNTSQSPKALVNQSQSSHSVNGQSIASRRRFSPVQDSAMQAGFYTDIETQENLAERKRLAYVAFTRASEQLYIVLTDPSGSKDMDYKPVFNWFETEKSKLPEYNVPDRLTGIIGDVRGQDINDYHSNNISVNRTGDLTAGGLTDNQLSNSQPLNINTAIETIDYPKFSDVISQAYHKGWAKTSFTALVRQLDANTQAIAIMDERIDDALMINTDTNTMPKQHNSERDVSDLDGLKSNGLKPLDDIRFTFVKGANAGTFLHEIYEKINFNDDQNWSQVIDRAIGSYQLPIVYASSAQQIRILQLDDENKADVTSHSALIQWIKEVLNTPLLASDQKLKDIAPNKRFAELSFNMGLSEDFRPESITELFRTYLPDEPDKHITLTAQYSSYLYRYLRGEIDLVYEHAGKYYVVDYKSNYLGDSLSNYDETNLNNAMSKAGYWLQACIYQVALHRFLSMRIPDYVGNEEKYLGAVEYVFLRGTYEDEATDKRYGLVTWDIPIDFLKALDRLFGKPAN